MCPRCRVPRCCGPAAPARTLCRVPPPPSADGGGGGGRLSPTVAALGGPPAVDASLLETEAAHQRWLAARPPAAAADGLVGAAVTSREVAAFVAATPALVALLEHRLTAVATGAAAAAVGTQTSLCRATFVFTSKYQGLLQQCTCKNVTGMINAALSNPHLPFIPRTTGW